jgi:hypothetical protein
MEVELGEDWGKMRGWVDMEYIFELQYSFNACYNYLQGSRVISEV